SSGLPVVNAAVKPLWDDLYAAGAEIVINAHYEVYERFAPQTSSGTADPQLGIRQFTVGTGGIGVNNFSGGTAANSEVHNTRTPAPRGGVLRLGAVRLAARRAPLGVGSVRGAVLPHRGRGAGAAGARVDLPPRRPLGHRRVAGATRAAVPLAGDDGSADVRPGLRSSRRRVGAAG